MEKLNEDKDRNEDELIQELIAQKEALINEALNSGKETV